METLKIWSNREHFDVPIQPTSTRYNRFSR
jgi:hypothetical protein